MAYRIDITGKKFNRLTALFVSHQSASLAFVWLCRCDCGEEVFVIFGDLVSGHTKSCGCLKLSGVGYVRHGKYRTRVYDAWCRMIQRCGNKRNPSYKHYGGRGIRVCKRWHRFENFYKDMGDPPDRKSIGRINNDGNYCPENCRWESSAEQSRNTRRNNLITHNGTTLCISDWAGRTGLHRATIRKRIIDGMEISVALSK